MISYNERAWAIDMIAHINTFCEGLDRPIKSAGGEHTINYSEGRLFPDILLF